jgi:hypothetical protein
MVSAHTNELIQDPKGVLVLEIQKKTLFLKLEAIYPECAFLLEDLNLHPLWCLERDVCPRNSQCMEKLVKRLSCVFDEFAQAQLILLYFKYRDRPASTRAGVFFRDFREPRLITFNRTGWEKMKKAGVIYSWNLPDSLFLNGTTKTTD